MVKDPRDIPEGPFGCGFWIGVIVFAFFLIMLIKQYKEGTGR